MPKGSSPISASPESLRRTRLYFGCDIASARRSRLRHYLGGKVSRLLLDAFTDHQEAVPAQLGLPLGKRLLDGEFVVNHERLAEQRDLRGELVQCTVDHFRGDLGWLAL